MTSQIRGIFNTISAKNQLKRDVQASLDRLNVAIDKIRAERKAEEQRFAQLPCYKRFAAGSDHEEGADEAYTYLLPVLKTH